MPPQAALPGLFIGQGGLMPPPGSYNASPAPTQQGYLLNPATRPGPQYPLVPMVQGRLVSRGDWQSQSDLYARQQSRGHRPQACGPTNTYKGLNVWALAWALKGARQQVIDNVETFAADPEAGLARLEETLWAGWDKTITRLGQLPDIYRNMTWADFKAETRRNSVAASMIVGSLPLVGGLYDLASASLGYDLITGEQLSEFEKAAITAGLIAGLLGASFLDELAEVASKAARYADDLADAASAARYVDELADAASSGRYVDELADAAAASRHLDQMVEAAMAGRYTDDIIDAATIGRLDNLAEFTGGSRSLGRTVDGGAVNRWLDDLNEVCGNSFTAGTLVDTEDGQKPIEEVEIGDKVLAEDPETGEQGYFEVVALTNHPTDEILEVTLDAGERSTDNEEEQLNNASSDKDSL